MYTVFELPAPWQSAEQGDIAVWTRPDVGIRVEVDALRPLPDDRQAWGQRVLGRHLPEGGTLQQTEIVNSNNQKGWPATVVSTLIRDAGGAVVEVRISVFYEFVYYGAVLVCRIPTADAKRYEDELKPAILEAMLSAEPVFRGPEVAGVGELWDVNGD